MRGRDYDHLFKLVIIGDSGVGKSSLLFRFADDTFDESYLTTIGVDFRFKTMPIENRNIKLQIWDTAGQERFRTITNAYYKGADAIIVVYDTTNQSTFDTIEKYWMKEIESYADRNVKLLLLGNKSDMSSERQVQADIASEFARRNNMEFFEVSAKTADSVQTAYVSVAKKLIEQKEKDGIRRSDRSLQHGLEKKKLEQPSKKSSDQFSVQTCCPN